MLTEGNLVNAGGSDPLLATIVSIDPIYLYFTIDERALQTYQQRKRAQGTPPAKPGDKLAIEFDFALDTDKGFPRKGTLDFADVKLDPGTGTITVRGTVKNDSAELAPGSRAKVRIAVSDTRKVATVPDRAILADQDRRYVFSVGEGNKVERRDVTLGSLLDDGMREISPRDPKAPAFKEEERIIVEGLLRARLHQPVEPVQPAAAGK
jgi:RND family efflux transporter MFP subunit